MTKEEYIFLYEKYLAGSITQEERKLLLEHNDEFQLLDLPWESHLMGDKKEAKDIIRKKLENEIIAPPASKVFILRKWFLVAAVFLLVVATGLYLSLNSERNLKKEVAKVKNERTVSPGGAKATLTLADGSVFDLGKLENGVISKQGNISIEKTSEGRMIYKVIASNGSSQSVQKNTIQTPRGGEYQIILADGSKVWLNAASILTFPTAFSRTERKVELTGEAYFEVAKNKEKPFIVETGDLSVNVLGTHFNIAAYRDESKLTTTLMEGSVRIDHGKNKMLIKPGQEASLEKNKNFVQVREVDVEEAIAWKNGVFVFNDENIESIMRKLSRWYDINVHFETELKNKDFSGTISRFKNVEEVLEMLQLTGSIHFKIQGRDIYVLP